jgi:hypothetical protein
MYIIWRERERERKREGGDLLYGGKEIDGDAKQD